jgi:hypothetical protein
LKYFLFAKKYLESTVNRDNSIEGEIKERIALGKKAFFKKDKAVQLQAWAGSEGSWEVKVPRFRFNGTGRW